ncbi:prolyl-tRNA editing enzyme YbaK/EbsC (Cys-tRNA(Pro) deacylase) [Paenibacillus mucilaginosus]|uniref:aminoacyl-tRNA deacylase n=1 Tax=Paenibacillus mucilaginosus TaxID=61624 RepID=UPI003D23B880
MDKLISLLKSQHVDFEVIEHGKPIHTAQEGADYFGIHIGQTTPTLLLKTDKGYYALVISGDYGRVDPVHLKELFHFQEIKLAKPQEVEKVTGSTVGSVALINPDIPTFIDRGLYRFDYVYGGTGVPQTTLKIRPKDIEKLNHTVGYIR